MKMTKAVLVTLCAVAAICALALWATRLLAEIEVKEARRAEQVARKHASRLGGVWSVACAPRADFYQCEALVSSARGLDLVMTLRCEGSRCFSTAPTRALGEVRP